MSKPTINNYVSKHNPHRAATFKCRKKALKRGDKPKHRKPRYDAFFMSATCVGHLFARQFSL